MLSSKENKINSTGTPVSAFTYTVNPLNQRTSVQTSGTAFATQPANWNWGYDALGQVVSADSPTPAFDRAYQYDAIGNRTSSTDNTALTTYAANALNQYSQISPPSPSSPVVPLHDEDGNQIDAMIHPEGAAPKAAVFDWDGENRLIAVKDKATSAVIVSYTYDAGSRRVARTEGSNTTVYLYDRWNCAAEYALQTSSFSLQTSHTWGLDLSGSLQGAGGVGGLLSVARHQGQSSQHFFPTFDGNGNISEYIEANGDISAHYEYDPVGRTLVASGPQVADFPYQFSTKPLDHGTELYYYGYRIYDPLTGRWINRDPIEEIGGVNLYGFVGNDGVGRLDLFGLSENDCSESSSPKYDVTSASIIVYSQPSGNVIVPDIAGAISGVKEALEAMVKEKSADAVKSLLSETLKITLDEAEKVVNLIAKSFEGSTRALVSMETQVKYKCCVCDENNIWGWGPENIVKSPIIAAGITSPFDPDDTKATTVSLADKNHMKALAKGIANTLIKDAKTVVNKCKGNKQ